MIKSLFIVLLVVLLSPLLFVLMAVGTLTVFSCKVYSWAALRWICWRLGNWHYLVWSSKRGWNDFVANNLLPALPTGFAAVAVPKKRSSRLPLAIETLLRAGAGVAKPYVTRVTALGVYTESLNAELWKLKKHAARNEEMRRLLRAIVCKRIWPAT